MNKNGKSSIVFLLLIPVFIIMILVICDTVITYSTNKRFKVVTESVLTSVMKNDELDYEEYYDEIKKLYEKNNIDTNMLAVDADEYMVSLDNEHTYFGLFTSITNRDGEQTTISILGVEFHVKKGSKTTLSVEASFDENDEIVFEYVE